MNNRCMVFTYPLMINSNAISVELVRPVILQENTYRRPMVPWTPVVFTPTFVMMCGVTRVYLVLTKVLVPDWLRPRAMLRDKIWCTLQMLFQRRINATMGELISGYYDFIIRCPMYTRCLINPQLLIMFHSSLNT